MWLYLLALACLYYLLGWYRERQVVGNLTDKYVFITGCSSGFGNELARQLDHQGLRVLASCRSEKDAEKLRAQMSSRLETVILDVTKTESIAAATQWVKERTGDRDSFQPCPVFSLCEGESLLLLLRGLWGLVNNAGVFMSSAPKEWLSKEDFMKVLDVNLLGLIEVTLSLLPLVRKARGRVVNVSSVAGHVSLLGGGYCISKYGVEAFLDSLRRELSFFGVKVAVIELGYFTTEMTRLDKITQNIQNTWERTSLWSFETYEKFLASYVESFEMLKPKWTQDLHLATDCMEHALIACHPRTRYSASWDAKFLYIPMSYLPTSLVDALAYWLSPICL